MTIRILLLILTLMSAVGPIQATQHFLSYDFNSGTQRNYGYNKEERYDVAIKIEDANLAGYKITGLSVHLRGGEAITDAKGWLSTDLILKKVNGKNVNMPDIAEKEGIIKEETLEVYFDTPYTVDGTLYVGYSFTVNELNESTSAPVAVVNGDNPNGLFIRSSRSHIKWNNCVSAAEGVSCMKVFLEGAFHDDSASVAVMEVPVSYVAEEVPVKAIIMNNGTNEITSIDYSYVWDNVTHTASIEFPSPIPTVWGASESFDFKLAAINDFGEQNLEIKIDKVNGKENNALSTSILTQTEIYPFKPVNRPLLEEYTGFWCGYCPKGYVALEVMKEEYPSQFVCVSYHSGDALHYVETTPNSPKGYPDSFINREDIEIEDIITNWADYANAFTPADIDVDIEWKDEEHTQLKATSHVRFIKDYEKSDFGVSYILVEDGLSNPSWAQSNYYSGTSGDDWRDYSEATEKWWSLFTGGPDPIMNLTYNDVALAIKEINGFQGSIPSKIIAGDEITHSCVLDINDIKNLYTKNYSINPDNLRVIAVIIDKTTRKPVNCNISLYAKSSWVTPVNIDLDKEVDGVEWYDLNVQRVANPIKKNGILIKKTIYRDGSFSFSKHLSH